MAESVFGKPIDTAVKELSDKIGTVPSGQTVEGQIDALNSKITDASTSTITIPGDASQRTIDFSKVGRLVQINIRCDISREFADGEVIASVPDGYAPRATTDFPIFGTGGAFLGVMRINVGKTITPVFGSLKTGATRCTFMYLSE